MQGVIDIGRRCGEEKHTKISHSRRQPFKEPRARNNCKTGERPQREDRDVLLCLISVWLVVVGVTAGRWRARAGTEKREARGVTTRVKMPRQGKSVRRESNLGRSLTKRKHGPKKVLAGSEHAKFVRSTCWSREECSSLRLCIQ